MAQKIESQNLEKLKLLAKDFNLDLLILFGSRAKGSSNKLSDWDLAYLTTKEFSVDNELILFSEIMKIFKTEKIDLINIKKNYSHKLRNEIFQQGICIYESKTGLFVDLKWKAWIDYKDFSRFYKARSEILDMGA